MVSFKFHSIDFIWISGVEWTVWMGVEELVWSGLDTGCENFGVNDIACIGLERKVCQAREEHFLLLVAENE